MDKGVELSVIEAELRVAQKRLERLMDEEKRYYPRRRLRLVYNDIHQTLGSVEYAKISYPEGKWE